MGATFGRMRFAVADRGVSPPQFFVLKILSSGRASTPKEVADALGVTPGNITGLIRKLERHGFVTRSRDAKDRRVVRLKVTAKARLGLEAVSKAARKAAGEAFDDWSLDEIVRLQAMLERLAGDYAPPDGPGRCGPWGGGPWGARWARHGGFREAHPRRRGRL